MITVRQQYTDSRRMQTAQGKQASTRAAMPTSTQADTQNCKEWSTNEHKQFTACHTAVLVLLHLSTANAKCDSLSPTPCKSRGSMHVSAAVTVHAGKQQANSPWTVDTSARCGAAIMAALHPTTPHPLPSRAPNLSQPAPPPQHKHSGTTIPTVPTIHITPGPFCPHHPATSSAQHNSKLWSPAQLRMHN